MIIGAIVALILYSLFLIIVDVLVPNIPFNLNTVIPLGIVVTGMGALIGGLFQ